MKRLYRNLAFFSLSGLVCLFLALPANAQHRGGGGGGHFGGGGGGHFSGGGAHFSGGGSHFSGAAHFNGGGARFNGGARVNGGARINGGHAYSAVHGYAGNRGGAYAHGYAGYRGGVRAGFGYRGGYGRGYGFARPYGYHGYGRWFGNGGWWFHGGFYGSLYYPRLGFSVGFLPFGYYPFYWGDSEFYYSNGFYYQYNNDQYTVVEPPVGAVITILPANAQSIVIDGQQYYELDGVYYLPITKDDGSLGYQIAGKDGQLDTNDAQQQPMDQGGNPPPAAGNYDQGNQGSSAAPADAPVNNGSGPQVGDLVQSLPGNARGVTVNGVRLFVSPDDIYYQATRDNNGNRAYKVVGVPSEPPNN